MDGAADTPARCRVYRRRRPERTPLYHAVQAHLETYLELAREGHDDGAGVPEYVEGGFAATSSAASWPTASRAPAVGAAATTS